MAALEFAIFTVQPAMGQTSSAPTSSVILPSVGGWLISDSFASHPIQVPKGTVDIELSDALKYGIRNAHGGECKSAVHLTEEETGEMKSLLRKNRKLQKSGYMDSYALVLFDEDSRTRLYVDNHGQILDGDKLYILSKAQFQLLKADVDRMMSKPTAGVPDTPPEVLKQQEMSLGWYSSS